MKTFKDLVFVPYLTHIFEELKQDFINFGLSPNLDLIKPLSQAQIELNGYKFSVLKGELFHSNGVDTYEAWAINYEDEPRGYLTEEEVTAYMKEVQEYKNDTK